MNRHKATLVSISITLLLFAVTVSAQENVQNLAVVLNGLKDPGSLSIVNLDEPNVKKAVENETITLGSVPNDIRIQGDLGYVVNTSSNNVQILDLRNRETLREIPIGDRTQPQNIAFVNSSRAYVTCHGTNDIRVVDMRTGSVIKAIPGESKPSGITILNGKAYVANAAFVVDPNTFEVTYEESSVTVIDTGTDTILKTIPVPTNASGVADDGTSRVLVLCAGDLRITPGELVIIDAKTDEVEKTVHLRTTPGFALVVNGEKQVFMNDGFLTNRGLLVYDLPNEKWIHDRNNPLADFAGGSGLAVDSHDNLYVTFPDWTGGGQDELRVMAPDETLVKTYRVGHGASAVAIARLQPIDINNDGVVDFADLVLVAGHFGEKGNDIAGDLNGDGVVDLFDLVRIATHVANAAAAPELPRIDQASVIAGKERIQVAIRALERLPNPSPSVRQAIALLRSYVVDKAPVVAETKLLANYPNPFNPETWMPFQLAAGGQVQIRIYDQSGQIVRTLHLGHRNAGQYFAPSDAAFWDGRNDVGERVTSGLYFYQLLTAGFSATRKMVILK